MLRSIIPRGARSSLCWERRGRKSGPLSMPAALMYSAIDSAALKAGRHRV
jgi:hypothetical protein